MVFCRLARPGDRPGAAAMNGPNAISLVRALLVPVIVWLILSGEYRSALYVFGLAALTDAADGFIAKRYGQTSELGGYLDPLADKLLLVSTFVTLASQSHMPIWLAVLVVARDLAIIIAVLLAALVRRPLRIDPSPISKANTVLQVLTVLFILTGLAGFTFGQTALAVEHGLIFVTGFLTALSLASYLRTWFRHMQE